MLILGIETSCDETAASVVKNGRRILSNIIASQIKLHQKTGGIVPEVAAREHVVKIWPVIETALKKAKLSLNEIDAIAVTYGPGLLSSLIIGVNAAMSLALVLKKPLIPVNHIEGHIYANWLRQARSDKTPEFPAAVLTVSGGHNELLIWRGHGSYKFLGATLDDAAGEAFDKVARLLGLPYPGGPAIQKTAKKGDPTAYALPRAWLPESPWDFSFSGLKTAVFYLLKKHTVIASAAVIARSAAPKQSRLLRFARNDRDPRNDRDQFIADVAASFQEAACEVLAAKLIRAAEKFRVKEIHLAGGVSANARLRELVQRKASSFDKLRMTVRYCKDISLCTDNAAMIAAAGFYKYKKKSALYKKWKPIIADPNLPVKNW